MEVDSLALAGVTQTLACWEIPRLVLSKYTVPRKPAIVQRPMELIRHVHEVSLD